jgi:hypothetical protein
VEPFKAGHVTSFLRAGLPASSTIAHVEKIILLCLLIGFIAFAAWWAKI